MSSHVARWLRDERHARLLSRQTRAIADQGRHLWQGEPIIGDPKMPVQKFFDEKTVEIPPATMGAKVRLTVSGHGQFPNSKNAAEFLGLNRSLWVNGASSRISCGRRTTISPVPPQKGTWKYDRAGWGRAASRRRG